MMKRIVSTLISILVLSLALPVWSAYSVDERAAEAPPQPAQPGSAYAHESWDASAKHPKKAKAHKAKPEGEMPSRGGKTGLETLASPSPSPAATPSASPAATPSDPRSAPAGSATGAPERQLGTAPAASLPREPSPVIVDEFQGDLNSTGNEVVPPDTMGAVGPSHIMSVTNAAVRIRTRSSGTISAQTLDQFWTAVLPTNAAAFDPRIYYDALAGRWVFVVVAEDFDYGRPGWVSVSSILVAVSDNSNPTGSWRKYRIDADKGNFIWADYPSVGFNKDWIVVQVNMFTITTSSYMQSDIYVLRRAQLNTGTLSQKRFVDDQGFAQAPVISFDPALNAIYMVEDWWGEENTSAGIRGRLRMSKIAGTVGNETYSPGYVFPTTTQTWNEEFGPAADPQPDAPQLGTTTRVDTGDTRMQNCVYRSGSIWCAHTVFLPRTNPTHSAVQWWQLTPAGGIAQIGRIDGGDALFHAFPSIAVNSNLDALLGYSTFSSDTYPSAHYAFRSATDPLHTFRADTLYKAGLADYDKIPPGSSDNRWGDYSNSVVDPLNDADLWTVQEYAEAHAGSTSIWATWWAHVPSVGFVLPSTLSGATSSLTAKFVGDTGPITTDNFRITETTSGDLVPGSVACKNAVGATIADCLAGVRSVLWTPSAPLVSGQRYTVTLNPDGATPAETEGNTGPTPTVEPIVETARNFRASTAEQENSAGASYRWRQVGTSAAIGSSFVTEHSAGAKARYAFTGTAITWYTITGPDQGIADVWIDGRRSRVDNYSPSTRYRAGRYWGGLAPGPHRIEIVVTGTKRSASRGTFIAIDAFTGVHNPALVITWRSVAAAAASLGRYATSDVRGCMVTFTFRGPRITWVTLLAPSQGQARVAIDGVVVATVDNYSATTRYQIGRAWNVADGEHTITITVLGTKNARASGASVAVDRFLVA